MLRQDTTYYRTDVYIAWCGMTFALQGVGQTEVVFCGWTQQSKLTSCRVLWGIANVRRGTVSLYCLLRNPYSASVAGFSGPSVRAERLYCDRLLDGVEAGMDVCFFDLATRTKPSDDHNEIFQCFEVRYSGWAPDAKSLTSV